MDQSSNCPENIIIASDRRKAIEELVRGRETAGMLQALLVSGSSLRVHGSSVMSVDHLLTQILSSFANTLSLLMNTDNSGGGVGDSDQVCSPPASRKSEDTCDSSKCTPPAPVFKDCRGCYKRRKTTHDNSWTTDTPDLVDNGHAWRKYGRKLIRSAKHPRNYFRCAHKYDQHCQATKQVQRLDEEPPVYRTTYQGHHTCSNPLQASQLIFLDPANTTDSSKILSFSNSDVITLANNDRHPLFFRWSSHQQPLQVPSAKHEYYNTCTTKENGPIINYGRASPSPFIIIIMLSS